MHRSKQSRFYKTFTRPIAKTLVIAVFTYQFFYWGWVKLETDEHQQKTDGTNPAEIPPPGIVTRWTYVNKNRERGWGETKKELTHVDCQPR